MERPPYIRGPFFGNTYMKQHYYAAIDLKSFYASVECVDRGLDPLTANLVVADFTRTDGTICLAVSPSLKALGLPGRCRLFEVKNKAQEYKAKTGTDLEYIVAPPRMQKYIDYSRKIYETIYTAFVSPEDILIYSIDEVFLDITSYLKFSKQTPISFTQNIVKSIFESTGLTATAGVGTNLYLAKIAMDILAKHSKPNSEGVRVAFLDEEKFKKELWRHTPLTDFWGIGHQTAKRLAKYNLLTFGDLARVALKDEEFFYKLFGVNAELFIDHLWGQEPTTMQDIKNYHAKSSSISRGQVLGQPAPISTARLLIAEMANALTITLAEKHLKTDLITLDLTYASHTTSHGSIRSINNSKESAPTSSSKNLINLTIKLFDKIVKPEQNVKRLNISYCNLIPTQNRKAPQGSHQQLNLLYPEPTSPAKNEYEQKQEQLSEAILSIQKRYGKNSILKAMNYEEGATARLRNHQIGGHHA